MAAQARTEFASALAAIAKERGLDPAIVLDTIKQAILAAYRRDARERGEETEEILLEANVNSQTGEARVLTWEEGGEDDKKDITPPGFGRIAAQTAKQVILQKIREAEKDAVLSQYETRIGSLVSGIVLRFDGPAVRVDIGRTEGIVPSNERIPSERLNINQRLTYLLKEIRETERGREIILSRSDPDLVKKLFAREDARDALDAECLAAMEEWALQYAHYSIAELLEEDRRVVAAIRDRRAARTETP